MGLAQKRISQEFQEKIFPEWKGKIYSAMGFEVPLEVKWETMLSDNYDKKEQYFEWYQQVYFSPLVTALTSICSDDMGRNALKDSLKKIVIDGSDGASPSYTKLEDGTLTVMHVFHSNVDDVDARAKAWTQMLESKL
jgi:hypothetical protein